MYSELRGEHGGAGSLLVVPHNPGDVFERESILYPPGCAGVRATLSLVRLTNQADERLSAVRTYSRQDHSRMHGWSSRSGGGRPCSEVAVLIFRFGFGDAREAAHHAVLAVQDHRATYVFVLGQQSERVDVAGPDNGEVAAVERRWPSGSRHPKSQTVRTRTGWLRTSVTAPTGRTVRAGSDNARGPRHNSTLEVSAACAVAEDRFRYDQGETDGLRDQAVALPSHLRRAGGRRRCVRVAAVARDSGAVDAAG